MIATCLIQTIEVAWRFGVIINMVTSVSHPDWIDLWLLRIGWQGSPIIITPLIQNLTITVFCLSSIQIFRNKVEEILRRNLRDLKISRWRTHISIILSIKSGMLIVTQTPKKKVKPHHRNFMGLGKSMFIQPTKEIPKLSNLLKSLHDTNIQNNNFNQMVEIQDKIHYLLQQEEIWCAERVKTHWLREGDKNTKYFNQKSTQRKKT